MASGLFATLTHPAVILSVSSIRYLPGILESALSGAGVANDGMPGNDGLEYHNFGSASRRLQMGHGLDYCRDQLPSSTCDVLVSVNFLLLPTLALALVLPLLYSYMYKKNVTDRRPPMEPEESIQYSVRAADDFKYPLCSCFDDCNACLHGFFCGGARAADSYQAGNIMSFWSTYLIFVGVPLTFQLVAFFLEYFGGVDASAMQYAGQAVLAVIFGAKRSALRSRLGGSKREGCDSLVDIALWYCCGCCVIIQEARSVDAVQNVEVECCCNLRSVGASPAAVGHVPVVTGTAVPMLQNGTLATAPRADDNHITELA